MKHKFTMGFALVAAFITYQDFKFCADLPWPPRLIFTGLVFGLLDLISIVSDELASVIAFGFVTAALMNTLNPNGPASGQLSFVTGGGDRCFHNECNADQAPTAGIGTAPFYPGATGNFAPIPGVGPIVNVPPGATNLQTLPTPGTVQT